MWESNNLDSVADEPSGTPEPGGAPVTPHAELVGTPQPLPAWSGPVLRGLSTPRVFSALASAASAPSANGSTGYDGGEHLEEEHLDDDDDGLTEGQAWSPEAAAARRRAQERWAELNPPVLVPPITLTEEEAAALLPPAEEPVEAAPAPEAEPPADVYPGHGAAVAPWLPAPTPAASVPVSAPVTAYGPAGKRRSPARVVLLSVLTLGAYSLWWHHRVNREMAEFDSHMTVDAGGSTWAVALPLLIGWLAAGAAVARYLLSKGGTTTTDLPFSATQSLFLVLSPLVVPYLELLLPFSAVSVVMTNERARSLEDRIDVHADSQLRPVSQLSWLAVPVVGGLVGMARLQRHLNEVWTAVSS